EKILDGFFSEVMVDPIDLGFVEIRVEQSVKFLRRLQVVSERFLHNDSCPSTAVLKSGIADAVDGRRKCFRRQSKVKHSITGQVVPLFDLLNLGRQRRKPLFTTVAQTAVVNAGIAPIHRRWSNDVPCQYPVSLIVHLRRSRDAEHMTSLEQAALRKTCKSG